MQFDTATDVLDAFHPQSVEEYQRVFRLYLLRMQRIERPQRGVALKAGIDCGRWVVNCVCGGGIALHPDWSFAGCFSCGRSWTIIDFPKAEFLEQVDAILQLRPPGKIRHDIRQWWSWWPEETLDDLRRENHVRGWPVPPKGPKE